MANDVAQAFEGDLDVSCIWVDLAIVMAKHRCAADGIEWDDDYAIAEDDVGVRVSEAMDGLAALVDAGLLDPAWYRWDEESGRATVAAATNTCELCREPFVPLNRSEGLITLTHPPWSP